MSNNIITKSRIASLLGSIAPQTSEQPASITSQALSALQATATEDTSFASQKDTTLPAIDASQLPAIDNSTRARALELLGKNIPAHSVASILNISPSRVSQFLEEPSFKEAVQCKLMESTLAAANRDAVKDSIEDALLEKFEKMSILLMKPMEILKALQVVSNLPRRAPATQGVVSGERTEATLTLPKFVTNVNMNVQFQFNSDREVVEVNGRAMQTMPMASVMDVLEARKTVREGLGNISQVIEHSP